MILRGSLWLDRMAVLSLLKAWAASLLGWTGFWLLTVAQYLLIAASRNERPSLSVLIGTLLPVLLWVLVTPFAVLFVSKAPLNRASWRRRLPLHILVGVGAVVLLSGPALQMVRYASSRVLRDPSLYAPLTATAFFRRALSELVFFLLLSVAAHAIHYSREVRVRDLKAARLEGLLAQARLDALKMQLHPHFLFNTLNSISALMRRDVEAADRMMTRLADLLRLSLQRGSDQVVPLTEELEFLELYLEIERTRFEDRLSVLFDVRPETLSADVPSLILQSLVENAVRHGVARRSEPVRIELAARREKETLHLWVRDDGPGIGIGEGSGGSGVGLSNTEARLRQLYGSAYRFELNNRSEGGLEVSIVIPFQWRGREGLVAEEPSFLAKERDPSAAGKTP